MNLGTLRSQAADFCGDTNQTRYSAAQYLTAANRAQEQFALDTKALWKDATFLTVSGTAAYLLSAFTPTATDFMWENWLTYDGFELKPISRHELNRLNPGRDWTVDTATTPTHFIIDPEEAQKKVRLYPIPGEAKTVSMRYFPLPAALSADADTPMNSSALMAQFHIAIAAYMAWLLLMSEEATPATEAKMQKMERLYMRQVPDAVDTFKNTASQPLRIRGTRIWPSSTR